MARWSSLALVAVVVGVQNPVDPRDPQRGELVEHGAAAKVDEHGPGALADYVDIADIAEKRKRLVG